MWAQFAIVSVILVQVAVSCPNGFVQHDDSCYKVFHIRGSWSEAKGYCSVFGAALVSIQSDRENSFLAGLIGRDGAAAYNPGRFWLDATDLLSEGDWVWASDNVGVMTTFSHWAPGQPSNTNNAEHCLALDFATNLMWNDEDCGQRNNFICEIVYPAHWNDEDCELRNNSICESVIGADIIG